MDTKQFEALTDSIRRDILMHGRLTDAGRLSAKALGRIITRSIVEKIEQRQAEKQREAEMALEVPSRDDLPPEDLSDIDFGDEVHELTEKLSEQRRQTNDRLIAEVTRVKIEGRGTEERDLSATLELTDMAIEAYETQKTLLAATIRHAEEWMQKTNAKLTGAIRHREELKRKLGDLDCNSNGNTAAA